jgi:hypothetical protein
MLNLIIAACVVIPFAIWKNFTTFEWLVCLYLFTILLTVMDIKNK